ncbi:unnamed protein product [Ixodes persulcatus]
MPGTKWCSMSSTRSPARRQRRPCASAQRSSRSSWRRTTGASVSSPEAAPVPRSSRAGRSPSPTSGPAVPLTGPKEFDLHGNCARFACKSRVSQNGLPILIQVLREANVSFAGEASAVTLVNVGTASLLVDIGMNPATAAPPQSNPCQYDLIQSNLIVGRCGALHVGDQLLAIDGTQVDQMSPAEAMQLLRMSVGDIIRLEILPISQMALRRWPSSSHSKRGAMPAPPHGYASNYDTLSSVGAHSSRSCAQRYPLPPLPPPPHHPPLTPSSSRVNRGRKHQSQEHTASSSNDRVCHHARAASTSSVYGTVPACLPPSGQLSHTETTQVAVCADHKGFGFTLQGDVPPSAPTIVGIDPRGPAERTGVIQIGDRVIAVNGQTTEGMSAEEVTQMVQRSRPRVVLDIDFDVAESVVPSSGTFTVKLAKKGPGLGITITSPKHRRPGEPLLISDIKRGSVAHRTGTLQPGDHLLAIDCVRMDNCTIEDAAQILQASDEVVKLRIRKDDAFCEEPDATGAVVFTVELARHGGPLGITISGTEEPFDPIVISGLTEGGLAERTGALHVGDRILAINGQSLRGKPLSEAILSLQNSGDVVTLKISKSPINQGTKSSRFGCKRNLRDLSHLSQPLTCKNRPIDDDAFVFQPEPSSYLSMYGTPIPSVDSAVESWDSYGGPEAMAALANGTAPAKPTSAGIGQHEAGETWPPLTLNVPQSIYRNILIAHPTFLAKIDFRKKHEAIVHPYKYPNANSAILENPSYPNDADVDLTTGRHTSLCLRISSPISKASKLRNARSKFVSTEIRSLRTHSFTRNVATADIASMAAPPPPMQQPNSGTSAELASWERDVWGHRRPANLSSPPGPASPPAPPAVGSGRSAASDSGSADWTKVLEDLETCGQSKLLRQIERSIMGSLPSIAPLPNPEPGGLHYDDLYGFQTRGGGQQSDDTTSTECEFQAAAAEREARYAGEQAPPFTLSPYEEEGRLDEGALTPLPGYPEPAPIPIEVHRVTLFKDKVYEDFGFSVSDGLYDKGVYVNRVRPGGPADMSGILKPYDRILQVNETRTHDFDCCLTVPLMAAAGDRVELIVSRPAYVNGRGASSRSNYEGASFHPWIDDNDREDCSSPPNGPRPSSQVLTKTL